MDARTKVIMLVTGLVVAVAAAACSADAPVPLVSQAYLEGKATAAADAGISLEREASRSREGARTPAPARAPASAEEPVPAPAQDPVGSAARGAMLIRTGNVVVRVDSLEPALAAARALASRLGGFVGNVVVAGGEFQVRSATIELRVPSARFDEAMRGIDPLGKVEHSSVTSEDVGEEYVDLEARIANSKRLEQRLISLLATRTGKLNDVLAVERELARVRQEIERVEGRRRYLSTRIAVSTVTLTLSEKAPLVAANPGQSVIGEAFLRAWRNFVGVIATGIASLGVLVPVALLVWVLWRIRPRRRARAEV